MKRSLLVLALFGACSTEVDTGPDAGVDINSGAISLAHPGEQSIARAMLWVDAMLHYCQAPNHQRDYDAACPTTCDRQDNVDWDPYRSDCSGFVSWAWGLPAPGRVTSQF